MPPTHLNASSSTAKSPGSGKLRKSRAWPLPVGDERATLRWVGGREPLAMQQDELKTDMLETA